MRTFILLSLCLTQLACDGKGLFQDKQGPRDSREAKAGFEFVFRLAPSTHFTAIKSHTHVGPMDQRYYVSLGFDELDSVTKFLETAGFHKESDARAGGSEFEVPWWRNSQELLKLPVWSRVNGSIPPWGCTVVWIDSQSNTVYSLTQ